MFCTLTVKHNEIIFANIGKKLQHRQVFKNLSNISIE